MNGWRVKLSSVIMFQFFCLSHFDIIVFYMNLFINVLLMIKFFFAPSASLMMRHISKS